MILSRDEFELRWGFSRGFETIEEVTKPMSVCTLMKEIRAEAKYRNHEYLFDGSDLQKLPLQEETTGIKIAKPYITTEGERLKEIMMEIQKDSYEPVELYQDIDHPTIIYVGDGFHRIFASSAMGRTSIICKVKRGHFILEDTLRVRDIIRHLDILSRMAGSDTLKEFVVKLNKIKDKPHEEGSKILFGDVQI